MNKFALPLLLVFVLCGCTSVTYVAAKQYPPVPPDKVEVLYEQPQRPHEVIALIDYTGQKGAIGADTKTMIQHCREEAAKIGADAVEVDELAGSGWHRRSTATAKAIKWK
jgi:hypothetical protein